MNRIIEILMIISLLSTLALGVTASNAIVHMVAHLIAGN